MASLPVKCRGCSKVFGVPADTPVLSIVKCPSCDIRNKVEPPSAFNLPLPTPAATKPLQGLPVRCRGCSGLFQTPRNTAPLSIVTCPTCNVRNKVQPSFDTDAPLSSSFSSSSSATPAGGRSSVPAVGGPADLRHSITFLEEAVEVLDVICRDCGAAFQAEQGQHSVVHCPACGVRNKVETAVAPAPAPTAAVSANADAAAAAAAAGTAGANPTVDNASTGAAHQRQQQQGGEEEGQKCHIEGFLFKQSVRSILGVHRFQKRYFVLEDNGKPSRMMYWEKKPQSWKVPAKSSARFVQIIKCQMHGEGKQKVIMLYINDDPARVEVVRGKDEEETHKWFTGIRAMMVKCKSRITKAEAVDEWAAATSISKK